MDLRHLLTLRTVVDKGSFSHAAEELGVSQPAVSFQIRSLEERLGHRLLDRSGRRVTLTDAGRVVDGYARRILAMEDDLEREISELSDHMAGPLVMGSSTGPGELLLPRLLGGFKAANPEVEISLVVQDTQTVCERVLEDDLELGVVGAARPHRGLIFEPFVRDELVVICPPDHPLATTLHTDPALILIQLPVLLEVLAHLAVLTHPVLPEVLMVLPHPVLL
jgi:DNA-binding transcriptional LysR family regulator